ncbi:MAG: transporter [Bacteroidetes bacterium GWF2_43_63]|nr:MAG: transporter [Bacteroidetes bacterium GWE2_42_42]OFY53074.1 MAG: transporter [Bacteroidetes bacterium GWF2_43_63]HBG69162.1 cation-efflux pump [Bacteroidales bacterium]HCB62567.1 cation-efflux pump [Bacteroidales bacterium]
MSVSLKKYIWLSIAAAVATIALKTFAWQLTGSVGLLSDALESLVNLAAAVIALVALTIAQRPADDKHAFGHSKAEYFSSAIEGGLIILAAASILVTAIPRLLNPVEIENTGSGLLVSAGASIINLVVAIILIRTGKKHRSIVLEADGKHLMTDVWTSVGVIGGIILVVLTGWLILDPIIAIAVAVNIVISGAILIKRSAQGLMDVSITDDDYIKVDKKLGEFRQKGIEFHSLLTRQAGQRIFISVHVLVPGAWSVQKGHDLAEEIEKDLIELFNQPVNVITHLEPIEDPCSLDDIELDRTF